MTGQGLGNGQLVLESCTMGGVGRDGRDGRDGTGG